jgi:hypothetical protein
MLRQESKAQASNCHGVTPLPLWTGAAAAAVGAAVLLLVLLQQSYSWFCRSSVATCAAAAVCPFSSVNSGSAQKVMC